MSERKIVVPEGMFNAYMEALCVRWNYRKEEWPSVISNNRENVLIALEAALRWLSDNPLRPTLEQQFSLHDSWPKSLIYDEKSPHPVQDQIFYSVVEWQRRMFLAPEPEIPKEIADLQVTDLDKGWNGPINQRIIEAYRRGQKAGFP